MRIVFHNLNNMPIRKIPKNYRNVTGKFASNKNRSLNSFESTLERDFAILMEFDVNVSGFFDQPLKINYECNNGKQRTYYPDFLVYFRKDIEGPPVSKPVIFEIKYRSDLKENWLEYKNKFKAAFNFALQRKMIFKIFTEKEIRIPLLENAKFLLPYINIITHSDYISTIEKHLTELRETDPQTLMTACSSDKWEQAKILPIIWHLIAKRCIGIDLNYKLTMHSKIWLRPEYQYYP